jgi:hypothetical protein
MVRMELVLTMPDSLKACSKAELPSDLPKAGVAAGASKLPFGPPTATENSAGMHLQCLTEHTLAEELNWTFPY